MRYVWVLLVGQCIVTLAFATPRCSSSASSHGQTPNSPSQVDVVGCLGKESGKLRLTDDGGNVYNLIGQTETLKNKVGDQLEVTGIQSHPPMPPTDHSLPETTLKVTKAETVFHQNPVGVRPILPTVATWNTSTNKEYGVQFRYPTTFENGDHSSPPSGPNFVDQDGAQAISFEKVNIPKSTYPDSNFLGGSFTAFADPGIHNGGTCRQFSSFWPEHTAPHTFRGTHYAQTLSVGAATGRAISTYYFHAFKNGLCYEFNFIFDESDTAGMMLPCSIQWVSEQNHFELMDTMLSQIRFATPTVKAEGARGPASAPTVVSFEHSPVIVDRSSRVDVSWTTQGADYVQLHYVCVKNLLVSDTSSGGELKCGAATDRNYPAMGSTSLMLGNFNPAATQFVITVEPFLAGKGNAKKAKTMTLTISPHPPVH